MGVVRCSPSSRFVGQIKGALGQQWDMQVTSISTRQSSDTSAHPSIFPFIQSISLTHYSAVVQERSQPWHPPSDRRARCRITETMQPQRASSGAHMRRRSGEGPVRTYFPCCTSFACVRPRIYTPRAARRPPVRCFLRPRRGHECATRERASPQNQFR